MKSINLFSVYFGLILGALCSTQVAFGQGLLQAKGITSDEHFTVQDAIHIGGIGLFDVRHAVTSVSYTHLTLPTKA